MRTDGSDQGFCPTPGLGSDLTLSRVKTCPCLAACIGSLMHKPIRGVPRWIHTRPSKETAITMHHRSTMQTRPENAKPMNRLNLAPSSFQESARSRSPSFSWLRGFQYLCMSMNLRYLQNVRPRRAITRTAQLQNIVTQKFTVNWCIF